METFTQKRHHALPFRILLGGLASLWGGVFSGCASSSMSVQTNPEGAEVFLVRAGTPPTRIGKSPLTLDRGSAPDLYGENFEILLQKEGFAPTQVVVPRASTVASSKLNVLLKEVKLPESCTKTDLTVNEVAKAVAEIQGLIARKKYPDAERRAREMTGRFGTVSVFHLLLGNALYLKKELPGALQAYKKARELDPGQAETQRMISKLSTMVGGGAERSIASDPAPSGGGN
jgi:hypothetical protein